MYIFGRRKFKNVGLMHSSEFIRCVYNQVEHLNVFNVKITIIA